MRNLRELNRYRHLEAEKLRYGFTGHNRVGVFMVPNPVQTGPELRIIADSGQGWDHVSVSTESRTPTWEEMDYVKRLFFKDNETAMQLHVPSTEHINHHPHCLHLWRPMKGGVPRPDGWRV